MLVFPRQVVGQDVRCAVHIVQSSWEEQIFQDDDFVALVKRLKVSYDRAKSEKAGLKVEVHQIEKDDL